MSCAENLRCLALLRSGASGLCWGAVIKSCGKELCLQGLKLLAGQHASCLHQCIMLKISFKTLHAPEQSCDQFTCQTVIDGRLQGKAVNTTGLDIDLVLIAMLSKGNDYMRAIKGLSSSTSSPALWKTYLKLKLDRRWVQQ